MTLRKTAAWAAIASLTLGACAHVETSVDRDALAASLRPEAERRLAAMDPECMYTWFDGGTRAQTYIRVRPDTPDGPVLGEIGPPKGTQVPVRAADVRAQYEALVEAGVLKPSERKKDGIVWFDVVDTAAYKPRDGYCYGRRTLRTISLGAPEKYGTQALLRDLCLTYVFTGVPAWANDPRLTAFNPTALRVEGQLVTARIVLTSYDDGKTWLWQEFDPMERLQPCD